MGGDRDTYTGLLSLLGGIAQDFLGRCWVGLVGDGNPRSGANLATSTSTTNQQHIQQQQILPINDLICTKF